MGQKARIIIRPIYDEVSNHSNIGSEIAYEIRMVFEQKEQIE